MRILLIRHDDTVTDNSRLPVKLNRRQGILPHLGLGYIASALGAAGHLVYFLDAHAHAYGLTNYEILSYIAKTEPDLIGLSTTTPSVHTTLDIAEYIKLNYSCKIVVGGAHVSLFPNETLSFQFIDYIVAGEGERAIVRLVRRMGDNGESPKIAPPEIIQDLDVLTIPPYYKMPMQKYSSIIGKHPVGMMMTSRGCPYKCSFCYKTPSDKKHRKRSPENIVNEMYILKHQYDVKEILFYDDLMMPDHVRGICEEILKRNVKIKWQTPQRVDLVDTETLKLMKRAGCRILRYGVEQGNPEMLKKIDKKVSKEMISETFAKTKEAGIDTFAYFIIGYIGETPDTMQETIDFAKELDPRYIMFTKAVPLPGTKLHDEAVGSGFINKDYWRRYSLRENPGEIKDFISDVDAWVEKAYHDFYLRPRKVVSQITKIRSFKDLKKNITGFMGIVK